MKIAQSLLLKFENKTESTHCLFWCVPILIFFHEFVYSLHRLGVHVCTSFESIKKNNSQSVCEIYLQNSVFIWGTSCKHKIYHAIAHSETIKNETWNIFMTEIKELFLCHECWLAVDWQKERTENFISTSFSFIRYMLIYSDKKKERLGSQSIINLYRNLFITCTFL